MTERLRVVQWTTGNIGREAVLAVLHRPDLELVGVFARSADKVGRDVADLVGLPEPFGVVATDDVEALLALAPDCVVYAPLHFDLMQVTQLLAAGINVVTTSEFVTGSALGEESRAALEAAATAGGASIFGSGMNPGYAQLLSAVGAGISTDIRHVKLTESVDVSLFAGDPNFDQFGWGRPAGDPTHAADVERATLVFREGVDVLVELLGAIAPERRCTVTFAHATRDIDLPGRFIAAGTVAGIDICWEALAGGDPVVELHQRYVMTTELEERWTVEHGYLVEVAGDPRVRLRLDVWPDTDDLAGLTEDDIHRIGMRMAAAPVVNAIPAVCAGPPGILTYAQLPTPTSRLE